MSFPAFRRISFAIVLAVVAVAALPRRAAADLVWSPQTGWRIEGGALSTLSGRESRNALDLMNRAREYEEEGWNRHAIKYYTRVGKKYPSSVYAPEAMYRVGKIRLARKQWSKSFDAFQQVVMKYPNTDRFNDVIGEQYRIASALLNGAREHFLWIFPGFTNREKGIVDFEQLLINAPYSDYAPLALMNISRGHQKLHETEEAIDSLDRLINNYPQSILSADAYMKLAEAHASLVDGPAYDQASTKEAITYYEDFMILFPSDNGVTTAEQGLAKMKSVLATSKIKIADFYFYRRDNFKAARVFYNEAITVYPDSEIAAKAKKRLADIDLAAAKAAKRGPRKHHWWSL